MLWRKRLSAHPEENAVTAVHPQNAIFTHLVGELSGRVSGAPRRDTKDYVRIRPRFRVPADLSVVAQIILCPGLLLSLHSDAAEGHTRSICRRRRDHATRALGSQ